MLKSLRPEAKIRYSANSYVVHRELVRRGLGVSFFPDYLIREDLVKKKIKILNSKQPMHVDLKLVARKGMIDSIKTKVMVDLILKCISPL